MVGVVFGIFIVTMFLGLPVAAAIGLGAFLPHWIDPTFAGNAKFLLRAMASALDSTPTLAIPLFMLSGSVMARGGISKKLFDVFAIFIGKFRAGMPCAVVITCLFFGAISGSGAATCAAVGAMCIPVLVDLGYDKKFAAAIVATASGLGIIIPPSIPFIMYGVTTGESVGNLFIAGILPGILIAAIIMAYCIIFCKKNGEDKERIAASVDALRAQGIFHVLKEGFWALLTPVIILGGIYAGIVTPTEAACISVIYALIVSLFIYKTMKFSDLYEYMVAAVRSYAPICLLLCFAMTFGRVLSFLNVPAILADAISASCSNKVVFLLALNLVLFILGMFMDTSSAIAIMAPMLVATATMFGINAIHFGVILIVNLAIGMVSPPIGLSLFVTAPLINVSAGELGKKVIIPVCFYIVALLLITFIPQLSLALL